MVHRQNENLKDYVVVNSENLKKMKEVREKIHQNSTEEQRKPFSCPSCNYAGERAKIVANHFMVNHENKFPYSHGLIEQILFTN